MFVLLLLLYNVHLDLGYLSPPTVWLHSKTSDPAIYLWHSILFVSVLFGSRLQHTPKMLLHIVLLTLHIELLAIVGTYLITGEFTIHHVWRWWWPSYKCGRIIYDTGSDIDWRRRRWSIQCFTCDNCETMRIMPRINDKISYKMICLVEQGGRGGGRGVLRNKDSTFTFANIWYKTT